MEEENVVKKEEMEEKIEVKTEETSSDVPSDTTDGTSKGKKEDSEKNEVKIDNNPDASVIADITDKVKQNPWITATVILALIIAYMFFSGGGITGNVIAGDGEGDLISSEVISAEAAGLILTNHLNELTEGGVEYILTEDLGSLYQVTVSFEDQEIPVFITKDGMYFIQGAVPITGEIINTPIQTRISLSQIETQTQESDDIDEHVDGDEHTEEDHVGDIEEEI